MFCEKPLTMTGDGARRMLEAAEAAGKVLGIGHELRYLEPVEALIATVGDGTHRQPAQHGGQPQPRTLPHPAQGQLAQEPGSEHVAGRPLHRHRHPQTDIFCLIAGEPAEVRAETDTLVYDPPAEDYVRVKILFRNGVHAMYSALSCTPYYSRFTAFGDKGWVELVGRGRHRQEQADAPDCLDRAGRADHAHVLSDCG